MSKWTIDKRIDGLSYGHRVWSQRLNAEFSEDTSCKCKYLHGHNATIHVFLESDTLTGGVVTDFKHINWVKTFLDTNIDHKFIIDMNDPYFKNIINGTFTEGRIKAILSSGEQISLELVPIYVPETTWFAGYRLNVDSLAGLDKEFYEGFFLVNFVPTSENLCKWLHDIVQTKMEKLNIKVSRIDWFETEKSRSSYSSV